MMLQPFLIRLAEWTDLAIDKAKGEVPIFSLRRFGTDPPPFCLQFLDRCIHQSSHLCYVRLPLPINIPKVQRSLWPFLIWTLNILFYIIIIFYGINSIYFGYIHVREQKSMHIWRILQSFIFFFPQLDFVLRLMWARDWEALFRFLAQCGSMNTKGPFRRETTGEWEGVA